MGGSKLTLQIWDTAGQERFKSMASLYFRSAAAAILVCDVTKPETLDQLDGWVDELRKHVGDNIIMAVAGNKCDMEKVITEDKGKEYATKYNSPYFETSAKSGDGVQAIFTYIAKELLKNQATENTQNENPTNQTSESNATTTSQPTAPQNNTIKIDGDTQPNKEKGCAC